MDFLTRVAVSSSIEHGSVIAGGNNSRNFYFLPEFTQLFQLKPSQLRQSRINFPWYGYCLSMNESFVQEIIMLTRKPIAYKSSIDNNVQNLFRWFLAAALVACVIGAVPVVRADTKPIADNVFIQDSFTNAQTEIEMSKVALEKSTNTRTKKLAKAIIKDNSAANAQLRALATTRRLTIPAQLDKDRQQQIEQLRNSSKENFDTVYRQHMQQTHVAAIELFDNVAKNPRADAELRVFASQCLPLFKKHQQMLEKIGGEPVKVAQRQPGA